MAEMSVKKLWELASFVSTVVALPSPTPSPEQHERMPVIFDMPMALCERAYLVTYKPQMSSTEQRRWNSWDDIMHEWCQREDFYNALPQLLSGEDPEFQSYLQGVAAAVRGGSAPIHP